jgi:mRNA interferase RelE/StbE
MSYAISILRRAQKELALLPPKDFEQVRDSIRNLAGNPRPSGCKKLTAREGWRLRVGKYRVIYEIDDQKKTLVVMNIGLRRDIYG